MHELLQRAQVENIHVPTTDDRDRDSESGTEGEASSSSATSGSQDELGRLNSTARSRHRTAIERVDFDELEDQEVIVDREDYDARFAQLEAAVKVRRRLCCAFSSEMLCEDWACYPHNLCVAGALLLLMSLLLRCGESGTVGGA